MKSPGGGCLEDGDVARTNWEKRNTDLVVFKKGTVGVKEFMFASLFRLQWWWFNYQGLEYSKLCHGAITLDHAEKLTAGHVVHSKVNFLHGVETKF